jgi:hypothetical protein
MTALMRAVGPSPGPKVLRAALIQRGTVMDERVLSPGESLSIGPTERSTFVVNAPDLGASRQVITPSGQGWLLHLHAGMGGQVSLLEGLVEVSSLKRDEREGSVPIALSAACRGKLSIGEVTLLFHFVDQPVKASKPQLPLSVQTGLLDNLDWKTTFIAAFSFLAHFGAVGSIYSDWTDPVVDDAYVIGQTLDAIRDLPKPAVEMRDDSREDANDAKATVADAQNKPTGPKTSGPSNGPQGPSHGASGGEKGIGDAKATQMSRELAQMDGLMVLGLRGTGRGTDAVLDEGNLPIGLIDDRAQSSRGVGPGNNNGLNFGDTGPSVVKPGMGRGHGLPGDTAVASNQADTGVAKVVKKPIGNSLIGGPIPSGGVVPNAGATVNSGKAGFRACYKRAMDEDPTMHGSVRITAKIGPNGEVSSASASGASGLSASLVNCLVGRVRGLQFESPQGGGATVVIPMAFEVQQQ